MRLFGRRALGAALALWLVWMSLVPSMAFAATPSPSPGAAGDTRSAGDGPGLVGAPGLAIGGVLALGLGTVVLTVIYIRLSERPDARRDPDNDA